MTFCHWKEVGRPNEKFIGKNIDFRLWKNATHFAMRTIKAVRNKALAK